MSVVHNRVLTITLYSTICITLPGFDKNTHTRPLRKGIGTAIGHPELNADDRPADSCAGR